MKKVINLEVRYQGDGEQVFLVTSTKNVTTPLPGETVDQTEMRRLVNCTMYDVNVKATRATAL